MSYTPPDAVFICQWDPASKLPRRQGYFEPRIVDPEGILDKANLKYKKQEEEPRSTDSKKLSIAQGYVLGKLDRAIKRQAELGIDQLNKEYKWRKGHNYGCRTPDSVSAITSPNEKESKKKDRHQKLQEEQHQ